MKRLRKVRLSVAGLLSSVALIAAPVPANATILDIVKDTFNTKSGSIVGQTPDTANVPGQTYQGGNNIAGFDTGRAIVGSDGSFAISIQSNGGYTKPTLFTISADLDLNGMTGAPSEPQ